MKFAHVGDLHLGKSLGDFDLIEDQAYILDEILTIMKEKQVDAILMAGDIYDKSVPSEAATGLLNSFLKKMAESGIQTFLISGNHDSDERLNFGSSLFESNGIYISAIYDGKLYQKTLKDAYGELHVYLLPFVKASQVRHFLGDSSIESYENAVSAIIRQADIDPVARNILVAHQFVTGGAADPEIGGSESIGTKTVGTVEKVGSDVFDCFDYVALGHIHLPQRIGRETLRYSGSPLKYSLSEAGREKTMPIVTMGEKGSVSVELVPLRPKRDLRHIKGKMKTLLDSAYVTDPDDYIYATLTDEDLISDAMGIFQQIYPRTVKIDYENSHTREVDQIDLSKIAENRSFEDLVRDFYKQIYGGDINAEELSVMKQIAKEVGIYEAD